MNNVKLDRNCLIECLINSGASQESVNILKGIKTITFKQTNTTILLTDEIVTEPLARE